MDDTIRSGRETVVNGNVSFWYEVVPFRISSWNPIPNNWLVLSLSVSPAIAGLAAGLMFMPMLVLGMVDSSEVPVPG